ncbi:membrane protein [Coprinopsis cinerea okayama7|uniref:Membrane protein n=1 Tax=Coprinopsis cinerea (strain Okayama-7 / 130 / ATCC MYA-4618 / FGSC 9003) TaxID=240176 RepID=A8NMY6_COPC7|nr:membrane protein [Coprinopsis cinerea okayama7\|eukprot:XP_001835013.2 membrane protein [Coprinopsis cinerea okayama7\
MADSWPAILLRAFLEDDDEPSGPPPGTPPMRFSPHEAHAHQAFFGWIMPTIRTSEFTILQIVGLDAAVHNKDLEDEDDWPGGSNDWPILLGSRFTPLNPTPVEPPKNGTGSPDWLDLISDANSYLSVHLMFTYLFTILALYFTYKNYRRFIRSRQLFSLELVHSIPARTVLVTNLPHHLQNERTLAEYFEHMDLAVESVTVCRDVGSLKTLLDRRTKALLRLERAWTDYVGNPSTVESYDPDGTYLDGDVESGPPLSAQARFVTPHKPRPTIRPRWFGRKVDALEYLEAEFKKADELVKERRRRGKFRAAGSAFVTFEKMSSAQIAVQTAHAPNPFQLSTYPAPEPRDIVWANMTPSTSSIRTRDFFVLAVMALLLFFWIIPISALASLLSYKEIKKVMPRLGELIDSNDRIRAIVQNSLPSVAMIMLNALLPFILEGVWLDFDVGEWGAYLWISFDLSSGVSGEELGRIFLVEKVRTDFSLFALMLTRHRYFLFLLLSVIFIFLVATTYWQLVRDLANSPAKVPEKLAQALQAGRARHFFLSYVILQGQWASLQFSAETKFGLLRLGYHAPSIAQFGCDHSPSVFVNVLYEDAERWVRSSRALELKPDQALDFAELNAPPMVNYGVVYPQAILMFVITLLYSVVQPLIVIFGAIYFGVAYVVYKYKLLFVFYKPYESQGQAWPITFIRLVWGIIIYLLFMIGIFTLRKSWILSSLLVPLLVGTVAWSWYVDAELKPLSKYVSLSSVFEVQRGEESEHVVRLRAGHPVTWSQSNLNRRRYAQNDDTLYVAPEDERTDYSQPPMANWYSGVLNTGKRRYGHPALNGVLPEPWLPLKKGQSLVNHLRTNGRVNNDDGQGQAVVLTLRKRTSKVRRASRPPDNRGSTSAVASPTADPSADGHPHDHDPSLNPWQDTTPRSTPHRTLSHRLSFDHATGVIMLPDEDEWEDEESDSEDYGTNGLERSVTESMLSEGVSEGVGGGATPGGSTLTDSTPLRGTRQSRYGTYFHHPERMRQTIPGYIINSPIQNPIDNRSGRDPSYKSWESLYGYQL